MVSAVSVRRFVAPYLYIMEPPYPRFVKLMSQTYLSTIIIRIRPLTLLLICCLSVLESTYPIHLRFLGPSLYFPCAARKLITSPESPVLEKASAA